MTTLTCRPRLSGVAAIILLIASGCAHHPVQRSPLANELKAHLGTIGIVQQGAPWLEWDAKPARGAGDGAVLGATSAWVDVVRLLQSPGDPRGTAVVLAIAPGYIGGKMLLGAVLSPPASTVERADDALDFALTDPAYLTSLRDPIARCGQAHTPHAFVLLPPRDPTLERRKSPYSYSALARDGVDTLIEISGPTIRLTRVGFSVPFNPRLRMSVRTSIRLVRTQDGEVIHISSFVHHGDTHTFAGWGAADAKRFRSEMTRGFDTLGQEIVTHVFGPPVSPSHDTREPGGASLDSQVTAAE